MTDDLSLDARDGLPPELKVLLDDYPREMWRGHPNFSGLTAFWLQMHGKFRSVQTELLGLTQTYLDAKENPMRFGAATSRYTGFFLEGLHGHHNIEDHHYFPQMVALDARVAWLMNSMLQDVVRRGTGHMANRLGRRDLAGKTGTTNEQMDAWFSGYSGGVVTSTWAGFDQNQKLGRREYGGSVALPMWIDYMRVATQNRPERHFEQPDNIVTVRIDPDSGQLAGPGQANAIFEYFRNDNAPTESYSQPGGGYEDFSDPVEIF